jgi:hypothetical protein
MGSNREKTRGKKTRPTVPFKVILIYMFYLVINYGNITIRWYYLGKVAVKRLYCFKF